MTLIPQSIVTFLAYNSKSINLTKVVPKLVSSDKLGQLSELLTKKQTRIKKIAFFNFYNVVNRFNFHLGVLIYCMDCV